MTPRLRASMGASGDGGQARLSDEQFGGRVPRRRTMTDSPSSDAPGDGQAQRPQPWFPPGGGYGPGSPPAGQGPDAQPGPDQPGTGQPAQARQARARQAWARAVQASLIRPAGLGGASPAPRRPDRQPRIRAAGIRAARPRPARVRAAGVRAVALRPVAALRRGRAQARRDPAPAAGCGRDPGRGVRLHPPQPQSHPGPRRPGHDDLGGHLRHDHPDAAQPRRPQPAQPGPAADDGPGHAPGGPGRSRWWCPRSG